MFLQELKLDSLSYVCLLHSLFLLFAYYLVYVIFPINGSMLVETLVTQCTLPILHVLPCHFCHTIFIVLPHPLPINQIIYCDKAKTCKISLGEFRCNQWSGSTALPSSSFLYYVIHYVDVCRAILLLRNQHFHCHGLSHPVQFW